jgi:hypothetical protein
MDSLDNAWSDYLRLRWLVADLKLDLMRRQFSRKYRPDQPRDELGRWVDEGGPTDDRSGVADGSPTDISAVGRRRAVLEARCLAQYALDTIVCTRARSRACHQQAALRYSNCLVSRPIPPLNY